MKKFLSIPIVAIALTLFLTTGVTLGAIFIGGTGRTGEVNLQKGLVGHWQFNGNALDSSSSRKHGTVTGTTIVADRKEQANKAYGFNGTSDFISLPNDIVPVSVARSQGVTYSAWVKPNSIGSTQNIVGQQISAGYSDYSSGGLGISSSGYAQMIAWSDANPNGNQYVYITGTTLLQAGEWYHIAGYFNPVDSKLYLYVNGVEEGTPVAIGAFSRLFTNASNRIGRKDGTPPNYFPGSLDDVRIYNRALLPTEITALYDQYDPGVRVSETQKGLVGNWKFDGNALDSSSSRNHGTVTGATLTTDRKGQSNKAYSFVSANDDYVNAGNDASLTFQDSDFSWAAWVYVSGWNGVHIQNSVMTRGGTSDGDDGWRTAIYNDGSIWTTISDGTARTIIQTSAGVIQTGQWYHIGVVYDRSGDGTIYVDGEEALAESITNSFRNITTDRDLTIGNYQPTGRPLNGKMDDVRIYNRALSPTEITDLYDSYHPVLQVSDLQKGLVGHWKMDGNAKDSTSSRNHGTVTGATLTTDRKGQSNRGYSFNGTSNFVGLGHVLDGTFAGADKKFSISAWIKPASTMTNNGIVTKLGDGSCAENQRQFTFRLLTDSKPEFLWYGNLGGGSYRGILGSTQITDTSRWYHVVAAYDGTLAIDNRVALYVDGVAENTSIDLTLGTPSVIEDGTAHLGIGKHLNSSGSACGSPAYFNGSIDDVRIYNRALTATEITALYESYQ